MMMFVSHDKIGGGREQTLFLPEAVGRSAFAVSDAVDVSALASLEDAQVEGEPDIVVELIDLYLEDASGKLAAIREAIAESDEATLRQTAHSLRGSSASLGAHRVAELCKELERVSAADSLRIESLRSELEEEYELVRQALTAARRRRS